MERLPLFPEVTESTEKGEQNVCLKQLQGFRVDWSTK